MKFDDFDTRMRVYETAIDQIIVPGMHIVARIDGRSFTRLTKEVCHFEAPFDRRFAQMMIGTVKSLMNCGFRIIYGYTESDEISLLMHPDADSFGRKVRKYDSLLAGQASAAFSLMLGQVATFDCRVIPLPNAALVQDYFLWRQEDAHRNSLNSHCYWLLRRQGKSARDASQQLMGKSVAYKNELLHQADINYNELPLWQRRGVGLYYTEQPVEGLNPITGQVVHTTRRRITIDEQLPLGPDYAQLIAKILIEGK